MQPKKNETIYYSIGHVSQSGMSRDIKFWLIRNNEPLFLNGYIAEILGYKMRDNGTIRVHGCGMDMGFHVISNLSRKLFGGDYSLLHRMI